MIPRKRFGQHFLCDQGVISQIVASLNPRAEEHLIEIGPGQGALTMPVLKQLEQLTVIELDRDLIPALEKRLVGLGKLTIYSADALTFDFAKIKTDERLLRVFGNLPYNISTPLIFHLLSYSLIMSDMLFMLQKEVADRLAAQPNEDAYGRLSVMVQYHCQVQVLFDVPPSAFYPPPEVQSSIVKLIPLRESSCVANDYRLFEMVVKLAFGQRRKTLRNSLRNIVGEDAWQCAGVNPGQRAENLSVKEFVAISNAINQG